MAVVVGHILLISTQVATRRGVPVLEALTFGVFAEVQRTTTSGIGSVRDVWQNYFALQQTRQENQQLRTEVAQLRVGLQQERGLAEQSRMLQKLLDMKMETPLKTTAAYVIAGAASPDFRTATIDKGSSDGLKPDMAVISPAGVVGRIILPTSRAAKIQLLIDRDAAAGAVTERGRAQGVVVGTGTSLRFDHVPGTADLKVGDRVVTSGIEGIYPKGFEIGQIESIERRAGEFSAIIIRPTVEFSSIEAVLVVLTESNLAAPAADDRSDDEGR